MSIGHRPAHVARVEAVGDVRPPSGLRLTLAEERRAGRWQHARDRASFMAARVVARSCVADLMDIPAAEVVLRQECRECGGAEHGAPRVADRPGVHVAWSHTAGVVAAVAATEPCGIDVEPVDQVVASALTPGEAAWVAVQPAPGVAFARLWTRKEALVKAGVVTLEGAVRTDVRALAADPGWVLGERSLTVGGVEHRATWVVRVR